MRRAGAIILGASILLPGAAAAAGDTIPPAFRGRWAPGPADCRDVDGVNILTVGSNGFGFYEDRSVPEGLAIETVSPRRIRIRTMMADSDRKRSTAVLDLEIAADGQTLSWSGFGRDPQKKQRDTRCPS